MKDRTVQVLFFVASALLLAQALRTGVVTRSAQAGGAGAAPAVVRAQMIELVDESGRIRANLKVEPDGEAVFRIMDVKGAIRVKLGAAEDGSGLVLLNEQTEPGIQMLAKRDGTTLTLAERGKETQVFKP